MTGCGGNVAVTSEDIYEATIAAGNSNGTRAASELNRVYAVQTTEYDMEVQELSLEQTRVALALTKVSGEAVNNATATSFVNVARVESELADSEIERQENIREEERQRINMDLIQGVTVIVIALIIVITAVILIAFHVTYVPPPMTIERDGAIITIPSFLIPANVNPLAQLPTIPPIPALPQDIKPTELKYGHVLVAGETGSGKTTALKHVLNGRNNVVILDPHDNARTWAVGRVIGGGRDFNAIETYVLWMKKELENRYQLRIDRNMEVEDFDPLTVATDEMPAIVGELGKDFGIIWRQWLREGRKVGLFLVVATQSTRVETLGIKGEGDLLENFTHIITLGKVAKQAYPDIAAVQDRPAVLKNVDGTFPIIIPKENLAVLPAPSYSDPEQMTEADKQKIKDLHKQGESLRGIEKIMYGYTGGKAHYAVKDVLDYVET